MLTIKSPFEMYNVFDRSRSVFDIKEIECLTPIGKVTTPKRIDELCYDSFKQIYAKAKDKQITSQDLEFFQKSNPLLDIMNVVPVFRTGVHKKPQTIILVGIAVCVQ